MHLSTGDRGPPPGSAEAAPASTPPTSTIPTNAVHEERTNFPVATFCSGESTSCEPLARVRSAHLSTHRMRCASALLATAASADHLDRISDLCLPVARDRSAADGGPESGRGTRPGRPREASTG